jgi:hypothetical protein
MTMRRRNDDAATRATTRSDDGMATRRDNATTFDVDGDVADTDGDGASGNHPVNV